MNTQPSNLGAGYRYDQWRRLPRRRGVAAVMAMMYLIIMSSLALGIFYSEATNVAVADNEQYIHLSNTAAESGLQFGRAQLNQINLPPANWPSGGLNTILANMSLNDTTNMGGHNPRISNGVLYIPGLTNGTPNWISLDQNSDQFYVTVQLAGASSNQLQVNSFGRHSSGGSFSISRQSQINYTPTQTQSVVFNYGLVSNGELMLNGGVHLVGTNNPALGSALSFANPAINVNNSNSFSGDFSYTYGGSTNYNYGQLTLDGYLPSSSNFSKHVHAGVTATLPTIDTSAYLTALQAPSAGSQTVTTASPLVNSNTTTTLTNLILSSGNYVFNKPITINGILYLQKGASVTFNTNCTVNGCIVQDNAATGGTIIFDGTATENPITNLAGSQFASEQSLTNAFLITPKASVTFNSTVTSNGSMIASSFIFDGTINANINGTVMAMSTSPFIFNSGGTINITSTSNTGPTGVGGGNVYFSVSPGSYQEIQ